MMIPLLAVSVSQKTPIEMSLLHTKEETVLRKVTDAVVVTVTVYLS
jgi:hypothetical protein